MELWGLFEAEGFSGIWGLFGTWGLSVPGKGWYLGKLGGTRTLRTWAPWVRVGRVLTKPLQLSQKVGLRKVTSWKVCKKARPNLEQMALARSRYSVSSSRLKEPLLGAETLLQHDWPLSPRPWSPGNPGILVLGGPKSQSTYSWRGGGWSPWQAKGKLPESRSKSSREMVPLPSGS